MASKWVDIADYFGPDRRRRPRTSAGAPASIGVLLRRLRVQMLDLANPAGRRMAMKLLSAAIAEAERLDLRHCAASLQAAERIIRAGGACGPAADAKIAEAMGHACARR
jgi:hypothetical protein